jgi:hypothetical protein
MKRTPDSQIQASERSDKHLLRLNGIALGLALVLLVGLIGCVLVFLVSGEGLLFGMLLGTFFPYAVLFALVGMILYIALLVSNTRAVTRRPQTNTLSKELRSTWLVFVSLTASILAIIAVCGVLSTPVIGMYAQEFKTRNPFLTAPVRSVPTYPFRAYDVESRYYERERTLHRRYDVYSRHPDEIADWYRDALSKAPWSIVQTNRYIERHDYYDYIIVRHCIQVEWIKETDQPRTYYLEIFGEDSSSSSVHVNIGTPNPITDVCERFVDRPD